MCSTDSAVPFTGATLASEPAGMPRIEAVMPARRSWAVALSALLCSVPPTFAQGQPGSAPSRGQLLYDAHCIQCHTSQVHWRDARAALDWASLRAQVDGWQGRIGERWSADDVDAVARHLNATIYHYPAPSRRAGDATPGTVTAREGPADGARARP